MAPASKQDIQCLLDQTKNRITERMVSKQDIQCLQDIVRGLAAASQQTQQLLRQADLQRTQLIRRAVALETRILQMEHELRSLQQVVLRLIDSRPEQIVIPAAPEENKRYGQYIYRPA
ncbi:MAG: hypothetical protein NVS1B7_2000 [Candidatus Saccharimonadales bacterium]